MQLVQAISNDRMADVVPLSLQLRAYFRRLSDVHNRRRIGSPRVTGSSNDLRSESRVGSSVILDLRPPPCRRIRSLPTEARSPRSSSPRYIVRRARPVASATALTPPCPIIRASEAAQRSAPLIQQRRHRLPTFPKSSDVRSAYHAPILSPLILSKESPSDNSCSA